MKKLVHLVSAAAVALSLSAFAHDAAKKEAKPAAAAKETTKTGIVTDPMCAKSGDKKKMSDSDCAKKCVQDGKYAFVSGSDVYNVDNGDTLKGHEGHTVKITGTFDKAASTVHVSSVKMVGEKKAKKTAPKPS